MGKNQQHKAMQQARHGGGGDGDAAQPDLGDGTVDVTFHSPEWHAARIAALTQERMSWEDFKKKQKEEAGLAAAEAEDEEAQMRDYRRQLDADRASRLAGGSSAAAKDSKKGGSSKKRKRSEKEKSRSKDKDKKGKKDKAKKSKKSKSSKSTRRRRSSSSDSSDSSSSGSEEDMKKRKGDLPAVASGPVKLSDFMKGA